MATEVLQAIRGMNDILPEEMDYWHFLESTLQSLAAQYGYQEIRTPIVERTELFARSIGEVTDIVEKEMYTFLDRNEDSLTLRPEGTASCARAGIEHGLFYNQQLRVWYMGPVYRHERPQKGRYRQFYQFGVEAIGMEGPAIDTEIIFINARLWELLGLYDQVELQINSLGTVESRARYKDALVDYFSQHRETLDADGQRRLYTNPLRILDSKNPALQSLISNAPSLADFLDPNSAKHFELLKQYLEAAKIPFTVNTKLVRGLDYYTDTVFEWVPKGSDAAQGTLSAGGRYDGLIAQLGGKPTPGVGFALGCERVIALLKQSKSRESIAEVPHAYFILVGETAQQTGLLLAEKWRRELPHFRVMVHCGEGSFKSQFKRADRSGANIAIIMGEDEVKSDQVAIKFLREEKEQQTLAVKAVPDFLEKSGLISVSEK